MYYFLKNGLDSNSNDADTLFVYWLPASALLWTKLIRGIHHTDHRNPVPHQLRTFLLLTLLSSYQKQNPGVHYSYDSVRVCITKQKPQLHTENTTDGPNVSFPKGPSQRGAHTKHFLVCYSVQFCTVHTSWFIISVCYRLNRAQGLKWFCFLCLHSCR